MDQALWQTRKKKSAWKKLVEQKIVTQIANVLECGFVNTGKLDEYRKSVQLDDCTNREAAAAQAYFDILFGKDFIRFNDDDINAALNYGYAILRNTFARAIVASGYNNALGIHHCNRQNKFNLACDLMEPFRPFVDNIVFHNKGRALDADYKKELIGFVNKVCLYNGKKMSIDNAIMSYVLDVTEYMSSPRRKIGSVGFDRQS